MPGASSMRSCHPRLAHNHRGAGQDRALDGIEDEIRGKAADLRLAIRQARAWPLLDELRKWMEKMRRPLSLKSETAGAIRYALSRWRALTRYTGDRRLESTTAQPNGRCVPSRSGARTAYSSVPIAAASVPPPSTASLDRPS